MTLRRLSHLLSVIAIALAGVALYIRPDPTVATCLNRGQASEIITACTALIENPDTKADALPVYLYKRAWAARRVHDFEMAMADITRALDLRPDTPLIWVNKAFINNAQGALEAADADFERALALEPKNLFTIMDRAVVYTGRSDYPAALRDYERAMQIDPNSKRAALGIIQTLEKMGEFDTAIERRIAATKQWPEDAKILLGLGSLQYGTQNYQAALVSFEAAARLDPEHELNLFLLGAANLRLGNISLGKSYIEGHAAQLAQSMETEGSLYRRATMVIANVTQLAGNFDFFFRGVSYAIVGQPELSRAAFQRYLDSGGSNAMGIMQRLLANYYGCAGAGCEGRDDERYEAALSRYIDATGNTFSLDNY
ncbi:MAG: tetratricopeptide repeat protein [Rhodobacteraceae bacterium]|nr:tetratricopeptide repeat protein [Paracoccaceae bacterium]